jgi:sugar phosphate isomerase/epimerase
MIDLGLSGRMIETGGGYQLSVADFIAAASEAGYEGIELRDGQLPPDASDDLVAEIQAALEWHGMSVAFANCSVAQKHDTLPQVARIVDMAVALECSYLRVGVTSVPWVQQACDIAAKQGIGLIVQIHSGGEMETIEGALAVCARVDRPNFGLTFEPANFVLVGRDYGQAALEQIGEKLFNVSLQNLKPTAEKQGPGYFEYQGQGYVRCHPDDPEGVDFEKVFAGLHGVGYEGFATLIEPASEVMDNWEMAEKYAAKLKALL